MGCVLKSGETAHKRVHHYYYYFVRMANAYVVGTEVYSPMLDRHDGSCPAADVELNVLGCRVDILGTNCDQCVCMVQCCFTSTETVGLLGTGAQDGLLDFHTAPNL